MEKNKTYFAPQLYIPHGVTDVDFYIKAFDAIELRRFSNDDGSIHVSELSIDGALFHLHEESDHNKFYSPINCHALTTMIGLFVDDVNAVVKKAVDAGAIITTPVQDYDYGYRQAELKDPYGHIWMIEMKI